MFIVKSLSFRRKNYYCSDPKNMGPLEGEMELINTNKTQLSMQLSAEQTKKILEIISEAIVDTAKQAGQLVTAQVTGQIDGTELLELGQ